jgi:aldehyde:ferredoxin oxidoreductase
MAEGDLYRAFGRGGSGAVMGAKNLKGITVCGSAPVLPPDAAAFSQVKQKIITAIRANPKYVHMRRSYGTGSDLKLMSQVGTLPVRNWQFGQSASAAAICTEDIDLPRRNINCGPNCPVPCSHITEVPDGEYAGASCDGPEYETVYAFASNCGIDRFDVVVVAAQLCDEAGLDTMSAGCSIAFAMECFERGLITKADTDGIDLRFGDATAMLAALRLLIAGEGFGARLAQGVRALSREIPGSEHFAMHSKGLEFGGYECHGLMGQALQYAVNNRGGCHHGYGLPARVESLVGSVLETAGKGAKVRDLAVGRIVRDSIPICTFPGVIITDALLPEILGSLTGTTWEAADVSRLGQRIMAQERLFNMREGLTREHDTLPQRLTLEPKPDGPSAGAVVPLETLKDDYYAVMGWDVASGNPTPQKFIELGIAYP